MSAGHGTRRRLHPLHLDCREHLREALTGRKWGGLPAVLTGRWRPQSGSRSGFQQGLCSVHTTFFCSSAMARRTELSRPSRSLQLSGARLLYRQGTLSSSPSSCRAASRNCSSELPSRCRPFLQSRDVQPEDSKVAGKAHHWLSGTEPCRHPGQGLARTPRVPLGTSMGILSREAGARLQVVH